MSKIITQVSSCIKETINNMGYFLEYVEAVNENKNNIIRVVIDSNSIITTEDCEKVSRAIEEKVDSLVNYSEGYVLEVSSPGVERKLLNIELYLKYVGQKVHLKLYKQIDGKKELEGNLIDAQNDVIKIDDGQKVFELNISDIAMGNTVYDFNGGNIKNEKGKK